MNAREMSCDDYQQALDWLASFGMSYAYSEITFARKHQFARRQSAERCVKPGKGNCVGFEEFFNRAMHIDGRALVLRGSLSFSRARRVWVASMDIRATPMPEAV